MSDNTLHRPAEALARALASHPGLEALATLALAAFVLVASGLALVWAFHVPAGPAQAHDCMAEAAVAFGSLVASAGLAQWFAGEVRPRARALRAASPTRARHA